MNDAELKAHADKFVAELLAKGMLSTPAMRQAVEACKEKSLARKAVAPVESWRVNEAANNSCAAAGDALFAEEAERAPKPRLAAYQMHNSPLWEVWERLADGTIGGKCGGHSVLLKNVTEQQARAVADTLNRLEAKP